MIAHHYAKLAPRVPHHQEALATFRRKYWDFYHDLDNYRANPSTAERERLHAAFDGIVEEMTGYAALDDRIIKTADHRAELLAVLDHPDLPLHNNDMELGARRWVRKRDVSFGPQSWAGAQAWDTFQTLSATAAKLGVAWFQYLRHRLTHPATTPSLAEQITQRTGFAIPATG